MDKHPIQGEVEKFLVASCNRKWDNLPNSLIIIIIIVIIITIIIIIIIIIIIGHLARMQT